MIFFRKKINQALYYYALIHFILQKRERIRVFLLRKVLRRELVYIVRKGGIGDLICILTFVEEMKRLNPKKIIVFETFPANMPIPSMCKAVDMVINDSGRDGFFAKTLFTPDLTLEPNLPSDLSSLNPLEKSHILVNFGNWFKMPVPATGLFKLASPRYAQKNLQTKKQKKFSTRDGNYFVIHTGATWLVKEWNLPKWEMLVSQIIERTGFQAIQVGDDFVGSATNRKSPRVSGAHDLVGSLSLYETVALLEKARFFIGIDSGILHMAGSVGTPCVGLFGPTAAEFFLHSKTRSIGVYSQIECIGCQHNPTGVPHWRDDCPQNILCMNQISVEQVLGATFEILKTTNVS